MTRTIKVDRATASGLLADSLLSVAGVVAVGAGASWLCLSMYLDTLFCPFF
jgi:hypothetical protein